MERPRTWGDCVREGWGDGEPCPWVGCSKHLLLDIRDREYGQGIRLNVPQRRKGAPSIVVPRTDEEADAFADLAVAELEQREHTCSVRVALRGMHSYEQLGRILGVTGEGARLACKRALEGAGISLDDEDDG